MTLNKKEQRILTSLGMSEAQQALYIALLQHGPTTISALAKQTGLNRSNTYDYMRALQDKGLAEKTKRGSTKYIAASPQVLTRLAEEQVLHAKNQVESLSLMLPKLMKLQPVASHFKTSVRQYDGLAQIRQAYKRELREAKGCTVYSFVGDIEPILDRFPESYWQQWNETFVSQKSNSKMLALDSVAARKSATFDDRYNRETRFLKQFQFEVNIDVFNNSVLLVSVKDEMALWIESAVIAMSYRTLFLQLWKQAIT